jgi:hypothetical protein
MCVECIRCHGVVLGRYTVTGSGDGLLRLWDSSDVCDAAAQGPTGYPEASCSSQAPECMLLDNMGARLLAVQRTARRHAEACDRTIDHTV